VAARCVQSVGSIPEANLAYMVDPMAKTKKLKISLNDRDKELWGPNEIVYKVLMAGYGVEKETIPYIDKNSTKEERDYMFEQLLKVEQNEKAIDIIDDYNSEEVQQQVVYVVKVRTIMITVAFAVLLVVWALI
jgi:hypothetical protein